MSPDAGRSCAGIRCCYMRWTDFIAPRPSVETPAENRLENRPTAGGYPLGWAVPASPGAYGKACWEVVENGQTGLLTEGRRGYRNGALLNAQITRASGRTGSVCSPDLRRGGAVPPEKGNARLILTTS